MEDKKLLYLAAIEAAKSDCRYQVGALALVRDKIVSKGFNRHIRSKEPSSRKGEATIHAEQLALHRTGGAQVDSIFIVRNAANGFSMALPCKRCMALIKRAGVSNVYYTDWYGQIQKLRV